uniref:hypothetical protein n=1 Tax=Caballeronia sp. GAFFF1 TaxID=2921779 RepID=UPI0020287572
LKKIEVGGGKLYQFASATQNALRGNAAGGEILLAFLSLYGQLDGVSTSMQSLKTTVGAAYPETLIGAWSASVGVFASGAELTGKSMKVVAENMKPVFEEGGAVASGLGRAAGLAKFIGEKAGVVGALSSFVDAAQDGFAAVRVNRQGDGSARTRYLFASGFSLAAGIVGVIGAAAPEAILLGPVGIAVVLGLMAYGFVQLAKQAESTMPDLWARRCYFGDHKGTLKPWNKPSDQDEAIATLNAILLGISVDVGFQPSLQTLQGAAALNDAVAFDLGYELVYRIVLPRFNPAISAYAFSVSVTRHTGATQMLVCRQQGTTALATITGALKAPRDYHGDTLEPVVFQKADPQAITGAIRLNGPQEGGNDVVSAQVHVKYYPDRLDESGFAELTVQEKF